MAKAWNIQLRADIGHKEDGPVPAGVDYETWLGPAAWIPFNENRFHYMDLPPILRQVVKAQIPTNGELSHGIGTQAVQQGVQAGRSPAA